MSTRLFAISDNEGRCDLSEAHWPRGGECPHVFVQRYDLAAEPASLPESFRPFAGVRLYLFGRRVPESTNSHWVHYSVIETRSGVSPPVLHELRQSARGDGVFYSTDAEHARGAACEGSVEVPLGEVFGFGSALGGVAHKQIKVFVHNEPYTRKLLDAYALAGRPKSIKKWMADRIRADFVHCGRMPRWTEDEGNWPFVDGDPMLFVAQTMLPENATTKSHLSFDKMLYLFVGLRDDQTVCKVYAQSVGTQTAEAHYRFEELVALYNARPPHSEVLDKVVKAGDRFVHEYLLDQADLPAAALKLLARHGANKELRTKAAGRLRGASSV